MSLLDDAQRLAETGPYLGEGTLCMLCHRDVVGFAHIKAQEHAETCPARSWPRIVALIEVAIEIDFLRDGHHDPLGEQAAYAALRRLLRGEEGSA